MRFSPFNLVPDFNRMKSTTIAFPEGTTIVQIPDDLVPAGFVFHITLPNGARFEMIPFVPGDGWATLGLDQMLSDLGLTLPGDES